MFYYGYICFSSTNFKGQLEISPLTLTGFRHFFFLKKKLLQLPHDMYDDQGQKEQNHEQKMSEN